MQSNIYKELSERKNPTMTFIGGLIIGLTLGSLITGLTVYVVMANYIIQTFN